jgi:hypothetical protein
MGQVQGPAEPRGARLPDLHAEAGGGEVSEAEHNGGVPEAAFPWQLTPGRRAWEVATGDTRGSPAAPPRRGHAAARSPRVPPRSGARTPLGEALGGRGLRTMVASGDSPSGGPRGDGDGEWVSRVGGVWWEGARDAAAVPPPPPSPY